MSYELNYELSYKEALNSKFKTQNSKLLNPNYLEKIPIWRC
jgi:hypothetical protein